MSVLTDVDRTTLAMLRTEVDQFYAKHFQLLDDGRADEWAQTYTVDGWFWPPTLPEPIHGRDVLAAGVTKAYAERTANGEQHRHWHGMVHVTPRTEDVLDVRCYALVFATPKGGTPRIQATCVCTDVLVREDGEWKVRERRVTRDDLP